MICIIYLALLGSIQQADFYVWENRELHTEL